MLIRFFAATLILPACAGHVPRAPKMPPAPPIRQFDPNANIFSKSYVRVGAAMKSSLYLGFGVADGPGEIGERIVPNPCSEFLERHEEDVPEQRMFRRSSGDEGGGVFAIGAPLAGTETAYDQSIDIIVRRHALALPTGAYAECCTGNGGCRPYIAEMLYIREARTGQQNSAENTGLVAPGVTIGTTATAAATDTAPVEGWLYVLIAGGTQLEHGTGR